MPSLRSLAIVLSVGLAFPAATAASPPPLQLDPSASFHLHVTGLPSSPAVAPAGDVNGDEVPDMLLGSRERDAVWVVFGSRQPRTVDTDLLGSNGFRIDGVQGGDAVGDVDHDGLADVVVLDDAGDDASAYVVFGRRATTPVEVAALGDHGFRIVGATGWATVAGAGDVNGDGTPDIVVATNGSPADRAFVVFGKASPTVVDLAALGDDGFEIRMLPHWPGGGASADGAGDVDGDGLADVVVGSPSWELYTGLAWVVFGRKATDPVLLERRTDADALFYQGGNEGASLGGSVAGLGDFDGNGYDDVAFAVVFADRGPLVIFGPSGDGRFVLSGIGFGTGGGTPFETWGTAAAGDVNGDGYPDVIGQAVTFMARPPGGAWIVFGGPDVDASSFSLAADGFVIPEAYGGVTGVGDMTGDGADDLGVAGGGEVRVVAWRPPCTRTGTARNDVLVGTIGDDVICAGAGHDRVDARGGDDVVLGGPGNDRLLGAAGDDSLAGDAGDDKLLGGPGLNGLHGGPGRDTLTGDGGPELLQGNAGDDRLTAGDGLDQGGGGTGRDTVSAGPGDDRMTGGDDADVLRGDAGPDDLRGDGGRDLLLGGLGWDSLFGGSGNDRLFGGDDGDLLEGDTGRDLLSGDAGYDVLDGLEYIDVGGYTEHTEPRIAPPARDRLRCGADGGEAGMADELDVIAANCGP